jgi:zinc protease
MLKGYLLTLMLVIMNQGHALASVHEYRLDNGLKLIVKEDHRAPVVVSQVWYKVGSSYEYNGITGVSHVLEHMMFKGTKKLGPGEFSRIISENGGRENAFTSRDYTAYFQRLEKNRLKISFELEADRMRGLLLPKEEFEKEVNVVMEERRLRTEDKPESLTYEQFNAVAYTSSPYRTPIIGWMDDLQNMRNEDLRAWYQKWYAPNNATVVVVGDVKPNEVLKLAKKYFASIKPSDIDPPKPQTEPEQAGVRRITVKAPAQHPYLIMGYKVPVLRTSENEWEPYALEVLAGILDGGNSSRIPSRIVRGSGLASSAGASYNMTSRLDNMFMFEISPAKNKMKQAEQALHKEIQLLQEKLVSADELERIKAQVVADNVFERDSVFYQAMQIGTLETVGLGWKVMDEYVDRIKKVTAEQVREVARKYLVEDHLTVAVLNPLPINSRKVGVSAAGDRHGH